LLQPRFRNIYFSVHDTEYAKSVVQTYQRYQFEQAPIVTPSSNEVDCQVNQQSTPASMKGFGLWDEYDNFVSVDPQTSDSDNIVYAVKRGLESVLKVG
jgi:hypothetical protein